MCGFVGVVNALPKNAKLNMQNALEIKKRKIALQTIENRGPDAEGVWHDQYIWMGHRRLSIVDTSKLGTQPMALDNYVLCFNGMIYNFKEIRRLLSNKGYKFQTATDTEVILAGWAEWNLICCRAFMACSLLLFGTRLKNV